MRHLTSCLALAALLALPACGTGLVPAAPVSKPVMLFHAPTKVQLGHPFPIAVDVDSACGEFRRLAIAENGIAKTITVDAMFQPPPPGAACIGAIVMKRYEGTTIATSEGTYTLDFHGYEGPAKRTLEVVASAVPAWAPPAFDPQAVRPNY